MGIGPQNYENWEVPQNCEGWEFPQSDACKLKNQESQWCDSFWIWFLLRPEALTSYSLPETPS
jgi:hypothetical protein